jgi:hypothetical protein
MQQTAEQQRIHNLEREMLELRNTHSQQVTSLQAQLNNLEPQVQAGSASSLSKIPGDAQKRQFVETELPSYTVVAGEVHNLAAEAEMQWPFTIMGYRVEFGMNQTESFGTTALVGRFMGSGVDERGSFEVSGTAEKKFTMTKTYSDLTVEYVGRVLPSGVITGTCSTLPWGVAGGDEFRFVAAASVASASTVEFSNVASPS